MNVPRNGVYYSTGATQRNRPSVLDAYLVMAGCTDRYALTTLGLLGVTRVSREAVFRAQGTGE